MDRAQDDLIRRSTHDSGDGPDGVGRYVEPIRVAADETAVVVIDMQNAYASQGGYVDLAGFDIAGAAGTISIATVLDTARAAGVQVVFLQNGWDPDYVEAGGPGSPNWHKSNALEDDACAARTQGQAARARRLGL
jgi:ureidoacrylate peracid hydrolase